jgi:hypothetical protein
MAEKLRAALSRRDAAIRDFYDIDHVVTVSGFNVHDPGLFRLIREKMLVPGNDPVDASPARLAELRPQVDTQLKPVLRTLDFARFDLERAFATVREVADSLLVEAV